MTGTALDLPLFLLLAAVAGVVLFRLLHLPPMLGYLAVGIVVGPHALGVVPDTPRTRYLAEFGVVFLMFSIGLEFNLAKLRAMRREVFGLGLTQVALTVGLALGASLAAAALAARWWPAADGFNWRAAFALGAALAMSSTAIVMKLLAERIELDAPHGRQIAGVLLFQDLAVVPLLVIVPALQGNVGDMATSLGWAFVKAAAVLALLLVFGQRLMRGWFHIVARRRSQELFMLNLLLITLGLSWITEHAGLSLALGAFVAGMLIAETEYRHQVEEDIKPFRDVLLGLFFITIGMLLNPRVVWENLGWVALLICLPVAFKFGLVAALGQVFGGSAGTAIRTGLALCTAGEFGFVLLRQAGELGVVDEGLLQIVLAAMLLSMLAAPFLIQYSDRIALRFASGEWMLASLNLTKIAARSIQTDKHVVICGFGRSGQNLARVLESQGLAYVALDLDPDRVREAAAAGDSVVFGDAARRESLIAAGISRAAALVVTYADTPSALKLLHHVQSLAPTLPVIVRTRDDRDLDRLREAGAAEVVPEVLEGSLMLGTHALLLLGTPLAQVLALVRRQREERYAGLRGFFPGGQDDPVASQSRVRLHSVHLPPGARAVGARLGDLGLELIGATVVSVRRREVRGADPSPELALEADDIVVLRGLPEALALAEERLLMP
ncbi:monovalent cation:proton antiporter-2 (CPA2) family protein [Derxia lacustris]|uniref:monovalent cation:proton antiporter-2 (CPA2) family protein n=1 Tax=Derxia lacustris TaxID=764842 RepID=UPI000A16CFFC|nr:monovalent cation:proton antiporter-2 (CPA2) family protein [Derxia lacustris]